MPRRITMKRFRLSPERWERIIADENVAQRFGRIFSASTQFFGPDGARYGFVNCIYSESQSTVVGYFAHEGTKSDLDYDSNNRVVTIESSPFAHLLFALVIPTGQIALQTSRITDFVDLNFTQMRNVFPMAIAHMFNLIDVPMERLSLQRDQQRYTTEELYQIFLNFRTISLTVTNLSGKNVPSYEEFKIFNPREEEDKVFRQVFQEDSQNGLDMLEFRVDESSDARRSALARLAAKVGDVISLRIFRRENERPVAYSVAPSDAFVIDISTDDEKERLSLRDVEHLGRAITIRAENVFIISSHDIADLPLFKNQKGNLNE